MGRDVQPVGFPGKECDSIAERIRSRNLQIMQGGPTLDDYGGGAARRPHFALAMANVAPTLNKKLAGVGVRAAFEEIRSPTRDS